MSFNGSVTSMGWGARLQHLDFPWHIFASLAILLMVAGARVVEFLAIPLPQCLFHLFTGHACMSCGMTRSLMALSHLDIAGALHFNPLVPLVSIGVLTWTVVWVAMRMAGKEWEIRLSHRQQNALRAVGVLAIIANWIYLIVNRI